MGSLKFIKEILHVDNIAKLKKIISKKQDLFVILQESKIKDIRCIKELKNRLESLKILVLYEDITHDDLCTIIDYGVNGFISPDWSKKEFQKAFEILITKCEFIFPRYMFGQVLESFKYRDSVRFQKYNLSKTETRIIKYLLSGKTNKEISKELRISEKTVKNHVSHILAKCKCSNRLKLVIKFLRGNSYKYT